MGNSLSYIPNEIKYKDLEIITKEQNPSNISLDKVITEEDSGNLEKELDNIFIKKGGEIYRIFRTIKSFTNWGKDSEQELIEKIYQIYKEEINLRKIPSQEIIVLLSNLRIIFDLLSSTEKLMKNQKINLTKDKTNAIIAAYLLKNL